MKKALAYLAPFAVVLMVANFGLRPSWESVAALFAAVLFAVAKEMLEDRRTASEALAKAEEYEEQLKAVRAELKVLGDAIKQVSGQQAMAKKAAW